jgi:hypothetical protein
LISQSPPEIFTISSPSEFQEVPITHVLNVRMWIEPVVSPLLDIGVKRRAYSRHLAALHAVETVIDTTRPITAGRVVEYEKRVARLRQGQISANTKFTGEVAKLYKSRLSESHMTRHLHLPPPVFREIPNWGTKLRRHELALHVGSAPTGEVITEDGMVITDELPAPDSPKSSPEGRLIPIKSRKITVSCLTHEREKRRSEAGVRKPYRRIRARKKGAASRASPAKESEVTDQPAVEPSGTEPVVEEEKRAEEEDETGDGFEDDQAREPDHEAVEKDLSDGQERGVAHEDGEGEKEDGEADERTEEAAGEAEEEAAEAEEEGNTDEAANEAGDGGEAEEADGDGWDEADDEDGN